jgi:hypothetical protein
MLKPDGASADSTQVKAQVNLDGMANINARQPGSSWPAIQQISIPMIPGR